MAGAPDPLFELSKLSCPCCYRPGVAFCDNPDMAKVTPGHKIALLRVLLAEEDVDAFVCLSQDNHSSEYVSSCDERRSYLTNFSGSAGVALVTRNEAMLFTDSRYYLQASNQLSNKDWKLMKQEPSDPLIEDVIFDKLKDKKVGIDPYQFPESKFKIWMEKWKKEVRTAVKRALTLPPSLTPLPNSSSSPLAFARWASVRKAQALGALPCNQSPHARAPPPQPRRRHVAHPAPDPPERRHGPPCLPRRRVRV